MQCNSSKEIKKPPFGYVLAQSRYRSVRSGLLSLGAKGQIIFLCTKNVVLTYCGECGKFDDGEDDEPH